MPAETAPQDRTWMAFPPGGYTLGETPEEAHEARATWSAVARAVLEFQPVTMVVDPKDAGTAARYLPAETDVVYAPLNDAWMRDIGPTFVKDRAGALAGVDWTFNGWGQQEWARWDKDSAIGERVTRWADGKLVDSSLVNEGGAIHVDGRGTVLVTETVQLDPDRNPGASKASVEAELARTLGTTNVIWLPCGLTRDSEQYGTRGHVDMTVTIPAPGTLLVHSQENPAHPDFLVTQRILETLRRSTDSDGNPWTIIEVPAPTVLQDAEGWVDYSYINHVVVNDGVIACSFDDPADEAARDILAAAYPGRRVVSVDARPLFHRGGGIHCITQQQPS